MLYPLTFQPIFQERVWGGRNLELLFSKPLPAGKRIGESWEISDRPEAESLIANGPLTGLSLRWLMEEHADELLGNVPDRNGRFPWLAKLLDAEADLSVQVHPPAEIAPALGGESKTEAWYIAHATPGSRIIAGLPEDMTRDTFAERLGQPGFADSLHAIPTKADKALFIPSGRLHALGAGTVVFEIQEDSDTTYRVYDWDRTGLNGQPRELHVEQALASIDFTDTTPDLATPEWEAAEGHSVSRIAHQPGVFELSLVRLEDAVTQLCPGEGMRVLAVTHGTLTIHAGEEPLTLEAGGFALLPASVEAAGLEGENAQFLLTQGA